MEGTPPDAFAPGRFARPTAEVIPDTTHGKFTQFFVA
jgi:hypothetical protein